MTDIVELLPCPFCGEQPLFDDGRTSDTTRVWCANWTGCGVQPVADAEDSPLALAVTHWNTRAAYEVMSRSELVRDAERFRALMRCPRIKMQGSAGVDAKTGAITSPKPGGVHFGAEFWPLGPHHASGQCEPTWGRHCLRALADDILAVEAESSGSSGHEG